MALSCRQVQKKGKPLACLKGFSLNTFPERVKSGTFMELENDISRAHTHHQQSVLEQPTSGEGAGVFIVSGEKGYLSNYLKS